MKRKIILSICIIFVLFVLSFKTDKPAYQIYNAKGKVVDYADMIQQALTCDVVLFGEMHDNPICHWMELEVIQSLYAEKKEALIVGAEMFETDTQLILDEYLKKKINASEFEAGVKLWKNYPTDYKPLMKFIREKQIPFYATNIPRRYASKVNLFGFETLDSLSNEAKSLFAPLPMPYDSTLECYKKMGEMDTGSGPGGRTHTSPNIAKAQAVKDATMAYTIVKHWEKGKLICHYHGVYHSDNHESMVWYLKQYKKDLKVLTISSIEKSGDLLPDSTELKLADFIISIPENMTKTY